MLRDPSTGAPLPHRVPLLTRRDMLTRGGAGFGALALAGLMQNDSLLAAETHVDAKNPLAPKPQTHKAKAKSVIFLFMEGAPSHMDTFDPKPLLNELHGQPIPPGYKGHIQAMTAAEAGSRIMGSPRKWKRYGQSGLSVSDWLPNIAECVDDLVVIRACMTDAVNHAGGVFQMNTGSPIGGRPSLGSWVNYGLGTENQDLPGYVVLFDNDIRMVRSGLKNWSAGFLPPVYQGTRFYAAGGEDVIRDLKQPASVTPAAARAKLELISELNRHHAEDRAFQEQLEARINSYELAFRMQATAPEAVDISNETEETKRLYGMDREETAPYGRALLLARRLVERGVRYVQAYSGVGSRWDSHDNMERDHAPMCLSMDKPVAGLLKDLKRRGLLEDTLVFWGGEFGRTPIVETNTKAEGKGRDHNPTGFTMWMAGGGLEGGRYVGETDPLGLNGISDRLHVLDLHSTIMHLMGVDPTKLTVVHKGRPERPNANTGFVSTKILGNLA